MDEIQAFSYDQRIKKRTNGEKDIQQRKRKRRTPQAVREQNHKEVITIKAATWKRRIIEGCKAAGTYREYFNPVIETLAGILEKRDKAEEAFIKAGGTSLVKHTNKAGATNLEQNPALRLINDLNRDALAYCRELGLTAASLKRINETAMRPTRISAFAEFLKELDI